MNHYRGEREKRPSRRPKRFSPWRFLGGLSGVLEVRQGTKPLGDPNEETLSHRMYLWIVPQRDEK